MTPISTNKARTAVFPGSFNPFTIGHKDIVLRGLKIFDRVIIAVGVNRDKAEADVAEILKPIRACFKDNPDVIVDSYSTLTVDYAKSVGAEAILRGVRSVKDFEYERDMADINRQLSGIETVILFSSPEYAAVSSSLVRELKSYGKDVSRFLP